MYACDDIQYSKIESLRIILIFVAVSILHVDIILTKMFLSVVLIRIFFNKYCQIEQAWQLGMLHKQFIAPINLFCFAHYIFKTNQ